MKTIEKTITYLVDSKEIASFFLNEFDKVNDSEDGFIVREVSIKRTDLGFPIMEVRSISNED